jgi:hypothetical protein
MMYPENCKYCGQPLVARTYPNCTTEGCCNQYISFIDDSNGRIFILPKDKSKTVKIVYEDQPCPVMWQLGIIFRCECAKSKTDDLNYTIYCSAEKCIHKMGVYNIE